MRDWGSSPSEVCITFYTSLLSCRYEQVLKSKAGGLRSNICQLNKIRRIFAYKHAARCRCTTKTAVDPGNRLPRITGPAAFGTHDGEFLPLEGSSNAGRIGAESLVTVQADAMPFRQFGEIPTAIVIFLCLCNCT